MDDGQRTTSDGTRVSARMCVVYDATHAGLDWTGRCVVAVAVYSILGTRHSILYDDATFNFRGINMRSRVGASGRKTNEEAKKRRNEGMKRRGND
jgi:hypothetical protein